LDGLLPDARPPAFWRDRPRKIFLAVGQRVDSHCANWHPGFLNNEEASVCAAKRMFQPAGMFIGPDGRGIEGIHPGGFVIPPCQQQV
jgi:hypothetical protein